MFFFFLQINKHRCASHKSNSHVQTPLTTYSVLIQRTIIFIIFTLLGIITNEYVYHFYPHSIREFRKVHRMRFFLPIKSKTVCFKVPASTFGSYVCITARANERLNTNIPLNVILYNHVQRIKGTYHEVASAQDDPR